MIEIDVVQNSDEWFELRTAKITGSHFSDIMPTAKQKDDAWSKGQYTYLRKVAAEILTGMREESGYQSKSMEWGQTYEPFAKRAYSMHELVNVRDCGFFTDELFIGSSPDGIIGNNERTIEVKCPESKQHLRYFNDPVEIYNDYKWQSIGEVYCSEVKDKSGVCISYDPRMPDNRQLAIYEFIPTDEELELLKYRLNMAIEIIKPWIAEIPIQVDFDD